MKVILGKQLYLPFPEPNNEIWLPVKGWEGLYEVSNLGRFKTVARITYGGHQKKQKIRIKETIRTHSDFCAGYLLISFCERPRIKKHLAHRIVAQHFIPNPNNKPQVNHRNGNKHDNRAMNLEWATEKENMIHAVGAGIKDKKTKRRKRISNQNVLEIFESPLSLNNIAKLYGLPKLTIHAIKSGKRYSRITLKPYFGKNGRSKIYGKKEKTY